MFTNPQLYEQKLEAQSACTWNTQSMKVLISGVESLGYRRLIVLTLQQGQEDN